MQTSSEQEPATDQATDAPPDAFDDLMAGRTRPERVAPDFARATLQRSSISEQIANRILGMIKSGNLKSGDKLPTEAQMGVALGISRPPLREALKALTLMGVLGSRQGGRYTVTDLSPSRLVAPFNVMLSIKDYDVDVHHEARAVVDLELVRLCGERASDAQRQRILTLAHDGEHVIGDPVAFRLNDAEFHQAVNDGAGNVLLTTVAQSLYDIALDLRRIAMSRSGAIAQSVADHCRIAEALVGHDSDAAVAAYREHLEHVRESTNRSLKEVADETVVAKGR